ncbi:MAG: isoleucine--tRNA ligase [Candidatus Omnitrophica bacterium]|nr:isoleucine--tRNA ligase [Candidatus Omnitrophota bacterium]
MDYKNTLNLPRTEFSMKADLPRREPEFLRYWQTIDIYEKIRKKPHPKGKYILHDGPPYANGNIHIGHALNKTLKDIIVKYKTMQGFDAPFVPGWDCHGLPVEHQLFKELKITKYQISQIEFRKKAHEYAMRFVEIQKQEFKRLGVFGQWDNPYLTLSRDYEASIVASFSTLVKNGYIYRGLKPVNWCFKCETALAEAEVEYELHTSASIFVKFPIDSANGKFLENSYLVIWTTTPWTLPANVAVAVHPDFTYSYIQTEKGNLLLATDRMFILEKMGIKNYQLIRQYNGSQLEGVLYRHPLGTRSGKLILADFVSSQEGTGLVHIAPGHGAEDYQVGLKYNLEVIMPVDNRGNFTQAAGEFKGLNVYEANPKIIEKLSSLGLILLSEKIEHSYPHCWRCKNPIIFRATEQWFLKIDHNNLRESLLREIKSNIKFIPEAGRERISAMVALRPDWCLSRQRYWGVPIPALVCQKCNNEFLEPGVIDNFAKFVAKEGSDCWFTRKLTDFLTEEVHCPVCSSNLFTKGSDILDVWFDSGVSHQAVLKQRNDLGGLPCDLYLEGSDQHRGWFQSSLIPAMCIDGKSPFKSVLTHGHVVDGEGRKMSKSLGNVIPPQEIIQKSGADIIRLWVAFSNYSEDIRISDEILARLIEAYRKIRNTARFILSNLYDFSPDKDYIPFKDMERLDQRILQKLTLLVQEVVDYGYEQFQFNRAIKAIYDFCNEELSMGYLDMVKGRLYTFLANSKERRSAQTALYEIIDAIVRLLAPILVFTAEDIWQHMPKKKNEEEVPSVHLLDMPDYTLLGKKFCLPEKQPTSVISYLEKIFEILPEVTKALEEKRSIGLIGSSFDAQIKILTKDQSWYKYLGSLQQEVAEIFKVSKVIINNEDSQSLPEATQVISHPEIKILVEKAEGVKCQRCWNYEQSVGVDLEYKELCKRCVTVVRSTAQ